MSATTLTPAEQAEVGRFGIYDEEILAEIGERFDDEPGCQIRDCENTAAHVLVCTFCNRQCGLVCTTHGENIQRSVRHTEHVVCGEVDMLCLLVEVKPL